MIINPITQPDQFRLELRVLSAYIRDLAKAARMSHEERESLANQHCRSLAFLGHDFSPSTGTGPDVIIAPLVSAVRSCADMICEAHIQACGDFKIPFSIHDFLSEKLLCVKYFHDNKKAGQSALDKAFEHYESFCFEAAFYDELAQTITPESGLDMANNLAANGLINLLPWYNFTEKRASVVFSISTYSERQYSRSYGELRVSYETTRKFRELSEHLKAFAAFSGDSDLLIACNLMVDRLYRLNEGFNLRETVEHGAVVFVFFKSKLELRLPHSLFGQLVAFCRMYGDDYQIKNRLDPNLAREAA